MTIESEADVAALRRIGRIVAQVLERMLAAIEPGMTTLELDRLGERWLEAAGARSAPRLSYGFPGATCISINEEAAHGIPGTRVIAAGDMVNVDVSAEMDGYFADTGGTRVTPPASPVKLRLCHATRLALEAATKVTTAGAPLHGIGRAVEKVAKKHRFKIIRNLCSHGVGRALHEAPKAIPSYFDPHERRVLAEGMVITIEPFLSTKCTLVEQADDGWTLRAPPGNLSAQYEHTMIVTRDRPIVVTAP